MQSRLNKTQFSLFQESDDNFESLVDLFTLLSFALIIASVIFGIQPVSEYENAYQLEVRQVGNGQSPPSTLPDDITVLVINQKNGYDILSIIKSGEKIRDFPVSSQSIIDILKREIESFKNSEKVILVLMKSKTTPNYHLCYIVQEWLAKNIRQEIKTYFQ